MGLSNYRIPPSPPGANPAAEEIKRVGAEVIAQARALRAEFQRQNEHSQQAVAAARQVTELAAATLDAHDEHRQTLAAHWSMAEALLQQVDAVKAELDARVAAAAQAPAPGAHRPGASPGALAPSTHFWPAANQTEFGFLYAQMGNVLQLDGSNYMTGQLGIGRTPAHELDANLGASSPLRASLSSDVTGGGNNIGLWLDKTDKTSGYSHCVVYRVGGANCWAAGMDVSTNNTGNGGTGNADFIPAFDYTGGYDDTGARTVPGGIDVLRFTPAESSVTAKCTTFQIAGQGAGRNVSHYFGQMVAGVNLGGIEISANVGTAYSHLLLTQRSATQKIAAINYNQQWLAGCDTAAANSPDFSIYDIAHSSTRLFVQSTANARALVGINQGTPLANLHIATGAAAGDYNTVQTVLAGGYGALNNRSITLQQILDASFAVNYLWLGGNLDATSTRAAPVANSGNGISCGIEATSSVLSLVAAPTGSAQTISRPLQVANAALGFFGTTPQAQPAGTTDVLASLVTLGLRAASSNPPLNLGTGALTCGAINAGGQIQGAAGAATAFATANPTPGTDADYTLTNAQAQAFLLVLSTGSWTAGRNVIAPATTGGVWMLNNLTPYTATIKTAAGTGVAVATNKSAIVWCNGTNIFRITPDT